MNYINYDLFSWMNGLLISCSIVQHNTESVLLMFETEINSDGFSDLIKKLTNLTKGDIESASSFSSPVSISLDSR